MRINQMFRLQKVAGEIGIEIEMEGANLITENMMEWVVHNDHSLRGHAVEYVLRHPIKRDEVFPMLMELKNDLKNHNSRLKPSDRCGVHVHLNMQEKDFNQTLTFITLYLAIEELMVHYCGETREGNLFCLRSMDAEAQIIALQDCIRRQSFRPIQNDAYRYASLNCTSLSKYGSLEFRSLQTPPDILDIEEWVQLLLKVKDAANMFNAPAAIVEGMSMQGSAMFLKNIFQEMMPLLETPDNNGALITGIRRVQQLAYIEPQPNQLPENEMDDILDGLDPRVAPRPPRGLINPWNPMPIPAKKKRPAKKKKPKLRENAFDDADIAAFNAAMDEIDNL